MRSWDKAANELSKQFKVRTIEIEPKRHPFIRPGIWWIRDEDGYKNVVLLDKNQAGEMAVWHFGNECETLLKDFLSAGHEFVQIAEEPKGD